MAKNVEAYFSQEEEQRIIQSIRDAEETTSGEIRVHISQKTDVHALDTTKNIFQELRMYNTQQRNGVLIHISIASKTFAIYGDVGIDQKVPIDFWETTKDLMQNHFKAGNLVEGICTGVANVGIELKEHFPWDNNDRNELSDELSYD